MQFIIKLFPEISLKSQSIQRRFIGMLNSNINTILSRIDPDVKVLNQWDRLIVVSPNTALAEAHLAALRCIPGIHSILDVRVGQFACMDDILAQTRALWGAQLAGKTFCVRVKRTGQHAFTSLALQQFVGGGLADSCAHAGVRMKRPDVLIQLEVQQDTLYLVRATHAGLGGYPVGTQEQVLSLLSGGFDSAVASWQFIKRGCRVHYCFFNLGGPVHLAGVQHMAYRLWQAYGSSHRVRFLAIDFADVLAAIVQQVPVGNQGVVLKRMMLRVADLLAQRLEIPALVTGEALGQVASQTLSNLNVIDRASHTVVLRPLVSWDKPDIIDLARKIGVADLAEAIPEYCGAISKNPTIKAHLKQVEKDEASLDPALLHAALEHSQWFDVRDFAGLPAFSAQGAVACTRASVQAQAVLAAGDVVIDVRAPDEVDAKPWQPGLAGVAVLTIPFYKLAKKFADLDADKRYFLYCERGVMSQLQVVHLQERGFANVFVCDGLARLP